jgi:hypothetical protein
LVKERFQRARIHRRTDEMRWLRAFMNYRGRYGSEVKFREDEKSKAFLKLTKTKVNAAFSQVNDSLFAANRFPISIEPTTLPEGVLESVHIDPQSPPDQEAEQEINPFDVYGFAGDGKDLAPGSRL